jgi:hypothetical protein
MQLKVKIEKLWYENPDSIYLGSRQGLLKSSHEHYNDVSDVMKTGNLFSSNCELFNKITHTVLFISSYIYNVLSTKFLLACSNSLSPYY